MDRLSTSKYNLNADFGLGYFDMIRWIIFNLLNNKNGNKLLDERVVLKKFKLDSLDHWDRIDTFASPARRMCDFYWLSMNWNEVLSQLGASVRAVEIGCGTGIYGKLIAGLLGKDLEMYRGIDINPNDGWKEFENDSRFQFSLGNASTIQNDLEGTNFIFTQSALEHFEEDMTFFKQVANYVESADHPVIQIHLVPSRDCITTFPWHGFRQYTNASISMITRLFSDDCEFEWVSLGGKACNKVHRNFITKPIYTKRGDLRKKKNQPYNKALRASIEADNNDPSTNHATFSALVIRSKVKG